MKFDDVIRHKLADITVAPPQIEEIIITTSNGTQSEDTLHTPAITKIVVPTLHDKDSLLQALHFLYTNNVHEHYNALKCLIELLQDTDKIEIEDESDNLSYSDELMGDLKALEGDDEGDEDDEE